MANLDSRAKEAESKRDMSSGQPRRTEPASKSQAMEQAKGESYQPRLALRQSSRIRVFSKYFQRDKQDAERDYGLDRSGRHMNKAERRECQSDRV
jgi:hypothetical protein